MVKRGAARIVPEEELSAYDGHINYLPHLAVVNPRSESTPVRIVFDASRAQGGGPSLNGVLAKGPDGYLNNLAGVIIRFRNGIYAVKGDVRKMYNCVGLVKEDCFVQCFLWRNLDANQDPSTYQVVVNNIGVKPAGCVATLCLYKSSDSFSDQYPVTSTQLKRNSYVDDLGLTGNSMEEIKARAEEADVILTHANMQVKRWVFSGDGEQIGIGEVQENMSLEETTSERMLGIIWDPQEDVFKFKVRVNLSPLKKKSRLGPDLTKSELIENPPKVITRREYYSQIQSLFDPVGFLSPILLSAKLLLRRTWEGECQSLGWDDPLPGPLVAEIIAFFVELFELESIVFPRSLYPKEVRVTGKPDLVIFSDGSISAFGSVSYVRWKLETGKWWSMLLLSKSKIAPKSRITVPRLELNGAVLSKRLEDFISTDLDVEFGNIYHLVDSSTVLGYLHKQDAKLKPYEGIRVSEIQRAGKFLEGRLHNWSWVETHNNPADWATKPRSVVELKQGGFWQKGPDFLQDDVEMWPVRLDFKTDKLEGELEPKNVMTVFFSDEFNGKLEILLQKFNSAKKLIRILAYGFKWMENSRDSSDSQVPGFLSPEAKRRAKVAWIKFTQTPIKDDLTISVKVATEAKIHGRFRRLAPFEDEEGVWRVGARIREFTPFTEDHKPPALLPCEARFTKLVMKEAHEKRHSGVADTVSQFRLTGYWTPKANVLAKRVKQECVTCRYLDAQPLQQVMGSVPHDRLISPSAWSHVEIDLFGPILCKSDVNKRSTKKVWGMLLIDVNSSAIHCDTVMDYSANEVVKALRRFSSYEDDRLK